MEKIDVKLDFEEFPYRFTCDGQNISPRVVIGNTQAKTLALILEDPDAPSGTFTHWIAWNIDPVSQLPENVPQDAKMEVPLRIVQGRNTANRIGYMGPCPPRGRPHRYFFKIFALDSQLDLEPGASRKDLESAMQGHILQYGEAVASYRRH